MKDGKAALRGVLFEKQEIVPGAALLNAEKDSRCMGAAWLRKSKAAACAKVSYFIFEREET